MRIRDICTPHLRLVSSAPDLLEADFTGDRSLLSTRLCAIVPPSWPPEHWEPHCLPFLENQFAEHPHTLAWSRYVVLTEAPDTLIGTIGGFPRSTAEAEIGYGILPLWQGRGLATEAALVLINEISRHPGISSISAQTFPHLSASVRVMEKCGMHRAGPGDEQGTVRYRMDLPRPAPSL